MKQSGICQTVQINRTFLNDILQQQLADLHNMIYKKEGKYVLPNLYLGKKIVKYLQSLDYLIFVFFVFTGKQTLSISDLPLQITQRM